MVKKMASGFDGLRDKAKRALADMLSENYLRELGEIAADMVRLRTRLGYGVQSTGEPREKLKPLSENYKKQRKKMDLNENTSPSKSNLTRTGQLLSSIGVKSITGNQVVIGPQGSRDDGKDNSEIAQYVSEQGRPFNNLSDVELKRLKERVRKDLQAKLLRDLVKTK